MDEQQIIRHFFKDEDSAISYIQNRLLGNFDEAPPPTSDRFIEEYTTDILQHLVNELKDKTIFWNACFRLFREWRAPEKADQDRATGLGELTYMIRQFNQHPEEIFGEERDRWQKELNPQNLRETPYIAQEENLVYTQNLSLVHIWDLWPDARWLRLYENILEASDVNNEAQFELMLIASQHVDWDETKTRQLFQWALDRDNLPETFYNQYFFHRLCGCGNNMIDTSTKEQKICQSKLVDDILKIQGQFFYNLPKEQKGSLGKALLEASELFDLKSFKCLDEGKRALLKRELDKLAQPPSEGETSMLKTGTTTPSTDRYMNAHYAGDAGDTQLAA